MEISANKERRKNKKYGPDLSEISAVTIRRLAWALNVSMGKAIEIIVRASPMLLNTEKICTICKDKKCLVCAFKSGSVIPQKVIPLLHKLSSTENP
jgi:hypothetical protein